jgi:hypothetical protein
MEAPIGDTFHTVCKHEAAFRRLEFVAWQPETVLQLGLCRQLGRSGQSFGDAMKPDSEDAMTDADQTGHTAHRNKLSRHWTKEVELDRKPQDSGPEKASCSEQQCYRLFDTQRLEECIDWIHCGSPEGDRTVCERHPPIVSSTGLRLLPFCAPPLPRRDRARISPQPASILAGVAFRGCELARQSVRTRPHSFNARLVRGQHERRRSRKQEGSRLGLCRRLAAL